MRFRRRGRCRRRIYVPEELELEQILPVPIKNPEPVYISAEELYILKLVDLHGLCQEEVAMKLLISRSKVSRLLNSARRKIAKAIFEGRLIKVNNNKL